MVEIMCRKWLSQCLPHGKSITPITVRGEVQKTAWHHSEPRQRLVPKQHTWLLECGALLAWPQAQRTRGVVFPWGQEVL